MKFRYGLMLVLLGLATLCAFFGVNEGILSSRASVEPERVTLSNLIGRGRDSNPNIILTDYTVVDVATEQKWTGQWTKVWVPVVPAGISPEEAAPAAHAVIFSDKIENEEQLLERLGKGEVRGLLDPESAKPSISSSLMWKHKFPKVDLQKCIIIVEGKQPAGIFKQILIWFGCAFFLALMVVVWYLARFIDKSEGTPIVAELVEP